MLYLQDWFRQFQFHPWHSNQLTNQQIKLTSIANSLVYEYGWQNANRAGRYDIRQAIRQSTDLFSQYAGYYPTHHFVEKYLPWPTMGDYRLWNYTSSNMYGEWLGHQLPEGYVHQLGYEHIQGTSTENITYSDLDNDGIFETATVQYTVPTGCREDEIYVQFLDADILYQSEDSVTNIKPRSVTISAGTATIIIDTWALVIPLKYTLPNPPSFDPSILPPNGASPFVSQVKVSRRFCDPSGTTLETAQAVLIWETTPYPVWALPWTFPQPTVDPSVMYYAIARGNVRDSINGIVYVGESVYDVTKQTWSGLANFSQCRPPDKVLVRYLAGQQSTAMDITIGRLTAAELNRPICAAEDANRQLANWQFDVARTGASDELYAQPNDFGNPIGSRRGHIYAWRIIQQTQRLKGLIAG